MRFQYAVTNNEYQLTDSDSIVSRTDLQGKDHLYQRRLQAHAGGFTGSRADGASRKHRAPSGHAGGSLCRLLGDSQGWQALGRLGQKSL